MTKNRTLNPQLHIISIFHYYICSSTSRPLILDLLNSILLYSCSWREKTLTYTILTSTGKDEIFVKTDLLTILHCRNFSLSNSCSAGLQKLQNKCWGISIFGNFFELFYTTLSVHLRIFFQENSCTTLKNIFSPSAWKKRESKK